MKDPQNIQDLAKLSIDYMGLIFYKQSPRYAGNLDPLVLDVLPQTIDRVGVFVNAEINEVCEIAERYNLIHLQLHGSESPEYCIECRDKTKLSIIKAFNVSQVEDFTATREYEGICDYFVFDTKTAQHGGSGQKFDWNILKSYTGNTPFFLSGGINPDDDGNIKNISHPKLYALDLNSKFEIAPGTKKIKELKEFIKNIKI